ncbi:hypothetical protein MBLNU459_g8103t1 [Dothideomycetes sp. NU459]
MADVNAKEGQRLSSELGSDKTLFVQADVSSYEQQANLFATAFTWGGNRLDFLAANAGIDDRQSLYQVDEELDEDGRPKPLNLKCVQVDLEAVFQGIWLFKHYARKNTATKGGKYCASKHALVGLARSAGPIFLRQDNITVNTILPAFVPTNLCPSHVLHLFPKEHITPMTTVLKAFDTFLDDDKMTGQTVELSLDNLYFRVKPEYANASQKWLGEDSAGFWDEAYKTPAPVRNGI